MRLEHWKIAGRKGDRSAGKLLAGRGLALSLASVPGVVGCSGFQQALDQLQLSAGKLQKPSISITSAELDGV